MNKAIVLYRSRYGFTEAYARMIAEALCCDIREASGVSAGMLAGYDTIIYGGGLYAMGIHGIRLVRKNFEQFQGKNLVVFATGISPGRFSEMQQVWQHNFPGRMLDSIRTFYLRGGFDYTRLSAGHKLMMGLLKRKLLSEKNRSMDEESMLRAFTVPENHCSRENITELVEYVKGTLQN